MRDKLKEWNEPPCAWLKSTEALCEHLRLIGLEATVQLRKAESLGWQSGVIIGSLRVANRNIDVVDLVFERDIADSFDEKYGSPDSYRCDFVVQAKVEGLEDRLKAKLEAVRKGFLRREVVDFKWKGRELAQTLNSDADLRSTLCRMKNAFFSGLEIKPDRKRRCVRIRGGSRDSPADAFPTADTFEAYDRIARHVRSIANVRP